MLSDLFLDTIKYVFNNLDDAVFITGKKGTIRYANRAAHEILKIPGIPEGELNTKIWEVIPVVEENDELIQLFLDVVQTQENQSAVTVWFRDVAGKILRLLVRLNYVEQEGGFFVVIITDITRLTQVTSAFTRYTSTQIADYVLNGPEGEKQGGTPRQTTILMSDIRGFSAICGAMKADDLVTMLNHYFETMVAIVEKHQGTVIEFLGDGMFIVFGAPREDSNHAGHAVACAVEMQNAMEEVNRWNASKGFTSLEMGIGISSGETVTGNIGSSLKMKYGCMGSPVNLAGRIEAQTVGGQILIPEATKQLLKKPLAYRGTLKFTPKGESSPLTIYDVTGLGDEYRLARQTEEIRWQPSESPVSLCFRLLDEHKRVLEERYECQVLAIADDASCVLIRTGRKLEAYSNIMFDTEDGLYAKVVGEEQGGYVCRFTHTPEHRQWIRTLTGETGPDA